MSVLQSDIALAIHEHNVEADMVEHNVGNEHLEPEHVDHAQA